MAFINRPKVGRDVRSLGGSKYVDKPTFAGARPGQGAFAESIYAGHGGRTDPVYGGYGGRAQTAFGGYPVRGPGGEALTADVGYPAARGNYMTVGERGAAGVAVVTQKMADPTTRKPVTVAQNRHAGLDLDRKLNRWIQARPWISAQIR
jgi:hypothetical protein